MAYPSRSNLSPAALPFFLLLARHATGQRLGSVSAKSHTCGRQTPAYASGFLAALWQGRAGTAYAGQVYVSMRGAQGAQDISVDVDLAASGIAHAQLEDLVNWWLRGTTTGMAKQIHCTRIWNEETGQIIGYKLGEAPSVRDTGELMGAVGAITAAVGHSLDGYLATASARLPLSRGALLAA